MDTATASEGITSTEVNLYVNRSDYVIPIAFAVIFFIGVIGNGVLILTVLFNKDMRTRPNIFIVSLAVGDLILLLVSIPFYGFTYMYPKWQHGSFACKLLAFLKALSLGVSIFTLTALSWDRYSACLHPIRRHKDTMSRTALIAAVIWIISTVLAAAEYAIANVDDDSQPMLVCNSHPYHFGYWFPCFRAWLRFVIYFLIPIIAIAMLYTPMAKTLWSNHTEIQQDAEADNVIQGPAATRQTEARRKIAKLVLAIVVLFMVCWLPRHIYLLWFHCPMPGEFNFFWYIWKTVAYCLCFSNSCINPLALCILSDQYRRYFSRYLCCCCRRESLPRVPQRAGTWQTASISVRMHHHKRMSTDIQHASIPCHPKV
ncbi:hypothetical protein CAPTEDRAFT_125109 [Capitella teleta]|uniref:G-protein coupled receptors family 1 profile domain-containing protein n=1 Tax=Capitella teleta TaxID=283909 RepID=R7U066_CAPTE|nr:hypothetical protein CAPTEDRAFT_125109 [Capitella teleta]|eukprot:ELT97056.1 hypothetical protein CAPTEDRAFT_125109 [Capitella teleta]